MKKYVSLIVCSVLLAIAIIIGMPEQTNVTYGRGNGQDCKVKNIEQFSEMLDFFDNYQIKSSNEKSIKSSVSGFSSSIDNSVEAKNENYTSATFYNKSRGASSYSSTYEGMSISYRMTFMRELTIYLTQTAAYYKSVGTIMSKSSYSSAQESESSSNVMDFDVEFYITSEKSYIKFNKFDITTSDTDDEVNFVTTDMLNKWFDSAEGAEYLLEMNQENYEILSSINNYFERNKFSNFKQSNNVYTIKDDLVNDFCSFVLGGTLPDNAKGSVKINLSNNTKPTVTLIASYSNNDGSGSASSNLYTEDNIVFSNINNTIAQFNANKIYDLNDFIDEEELW